MCFLEQLQSGNVLINNLTILIGFFTRVDIFAAFLALQSSSVVDTSTFQDPSGISTSTSQDYSLYPSSIPVSVSETTLYSFFSTFQKKFGHCYLDCARFVWHLCSSTTSIPRESHSPTVLYSARANCSSFHPCHNVKSRSFLL